MGEEHPFQVFSVRGFPGGIQNNRTNPLDDNTGMLCDGRNVDVSRGYAEVRPGFVTVAGGGDVSLTPVMTDSNVPTPCEVTGTASSSSHALWYCFDGVTAADSTAYYLSASSPSEEFPCRIMFDFGTGNTETVASYTLFARTVDEGFPKTWIFQGSNDASAVYTDASDSGKWDTLDTVTDEPTASGVSFTFSNTTAYRKYRFIITDTQTAFVSVGLTEITLGGALALDGVVLRRLALVKTGELTDDTHRYFVLDNVDADGDRSSIVTLSGTYDALSVADDWWSNSDGTPCAVSALNSRAVVTSAGQYPYVFSGDAWAPKNVMVSYDSGSNWRDATARLCDGDTGTYVDGITATTVVAICCDVDTIESVSFPGGGIDKTTLTESGGPVTYWDGTTWTSTGWTNTFDGDDTWTKTSGTAVTMAYSVLNGVPGYWLKITFDAELTGCQLRGVRIYGQPQRLRNIGDGQPSNVLAFIYDQAAGTTAANAWETGKTYIVGACAYYVTTGKYYVCIRDVASAIDTSQYPVYSATSQYYVGQGVQYSGAYYECVTNTPVVVSRGGASVFSTSDKYFVGEIVVSGATYYECIMDTPDVIIGTPPPTWKQYTLPGFSTPYTLYVKGSRVTYSGKYYECTSSITQKLLSTDGTTVHYVQYTDVPTNTTYWTEIFVATPAVTSTRYWKVVYTSYTWSQVSRYFKLATGEAVSPTPTNTDYWAELDLAHFGDYSVEVSDNTDLTYCPLSNGSDAATLKGMDTTDSLYVCSARPFSGMNITVDPTHKNANTSTIQLSYWNGSTWASLVVNDDTSVSGVTLTRKGKISFATPTAWVASRNGNESYPLGYWLKVTVSAQLSNDCRILQCGLEENPEDLKQYAFCCTFRNRMALGRRSDAWDQVDISREWEEYGFDGPQSSSLRVGGMGDIIAMFTMFDQVFIAKPDQWYLISGTDPSTFASEAIETAKQAPTSQRCLIHGTYRDSSGQERLGAFFVNSSGAWHFDGVRLTCISQSVDWWDNDGTGLRIMQTEMDNACGELWPLRQQVMWSVPMTEDGTTYTMKIIVFDLTMQAWLPPYDIPAKALCYADMPDYGPCMYAVLGLTDQGVVRMLDPLVTDDDGTAVGGWIETPWLHLGSPEWDKQLRHITFYGSGVISASIYVDGDNLVAASQVNLTALSDTDGKDFTFGQHNRNVHGRWFKLRFDMTGCGTKLYGFDVEYGLVRTWRTGA